MKHAKKQKKQRPYTEGEKQSVEAVLEEAQTLDLSVKDFKSSILNMLKRLNEAMF